MTITIKETTITLKKTFRSIIAYESALNKSFNPQTVSDMIMYFYCVIIASETNIELSYDDFLTWLDINPKALQDFSQWVIKQAEIESTLTKKKTVKTKKKAQ